MPYNGLRKQLGLDKNKPRPQPPATPPPPPPPRPAAQADGKKPKKKKPEPVEADGKHTITQACGHRIGVRFMQQRPCAECTRRNRRNRQQARHQALKRVQGRLPDNACFHVLYDAASTTWTGTLTVGEKVFEVQASGVFNVLTKLDTMYRATLAAEVPS